MSDCGCGGKSTQKMPWQGKSFNSVGSAMASNTMQVKVSKGKKSTKVTVKKK
jgi:hypothetical protein